MNRRRTLAKQAGIILMAIGGMMLFASAMIGPAIEPPVDMKPAAVTALVMISVGLTFVMMFRRESRPATRGGETAERAESRAEPRSEPVAPKAAH